MAGLLLAVTQTPEVVSPSGLRFYARPDTAGVVARAESALARVPRDVDSLLALGRAQASVWRYRDAVATYTNGLAVAYDWGGALFYRHRGHRYISLRRLREAVADLEHAAAIDTSKYDFGSARAPSFDVWYHLALAYYLTGRFTEAAEAYGRALATGRTADDTVAASDWLWMALSRAGQGAAAARVLVPITDSMGVRENGPYYQRLLLYAGRRTEADLRTLMATGDL
ncbi:MAG: tetratricopeptide repeat protein, partial [Gemmatimonadales bacterium]